MKLNDKQRELVERNHNLIYSFLAKYRLSREEFYDVAAIGMCKAALIYDPHKGAFSTLVYKVMTQEVLHKIRDERRKKDVPKEIIESYDALFDSDNAEDVSLSDVLKSDVDVEQQCLNKICIDIFFNSLDGTSLTILNMRAQGCMQQEIGDRVNLSQMQISRRLKKMKEQCRKMLYA